MPANRLEVVECRAALEAVRARDLDGEPHGTGPRDVLCQHILIRACAGPFAATDLFAEVTSAGAYADLGRAEFDACLEFCATGVMRSGPMTNGSACNSAPTGSGSCAILGPHG